jgi:hypothetical protein
MAQVLTASERKLSSKLNSIDNRWFRRRVIRNPTVPPGDRAAPAVVMVESGDATLGTEVRGVAKSLKSTGPSAKNQEDTARLKGKEGNEAGGGDVPPHLSSV